MTRLVALCFYDPVYYKEYGFSSALSHRQLTPSRLIPIFPCLSRSDHCHEKDLHGLSQTQEEMRVCRVCFIKMVLLRSCGAQLGEHRGWSSQVVFLKFCIPIFQEVTLLKKQWSLEELRGCLVIYLVVSLKHQHFVFLISAIYILFAFLQLALLVLVCLFAIKGLCVAFFFALQLEYSLWLTLLPKLTHFSLSYSDPFLWGRGSDSFLLHSGYFSRDHQVISRIKSHYYLSGFLTMQTRAPHVFTVQKRA